MKNFCYIITLFLISLMIFTAAYAQIDKGKSVFMGSYEQDNNTENGKEPIEWIVLDVSDNQALLLSRYALDAQPYNTEFTEVTWEKSSLRNWLNTDFYESAFLKDEQEKIVTTGLTNAENPAYKTTGGNNTSDKLFLLSIPEVKQYFREGPQLECKPTDYTKARGIENDPSVKENDSAVWWWWLRTPGSQMDYGAAVNINGAIVNIGFHVDDSYVGVRPAFWMNLSESIVAEAEQSTEASQPAAETPEALSSFDPEDSVILQSFPTEDDYTITIHDDGTAEITKYLGTAQEISVPSEIHGHKITSIGDFAFFSNSNVKTITLPEGLTTIGDSAFSVCKNLKTVILSEV